MKGYKGSAGLQAGVPAVTATGRAPYQSNNLLVPIHRNKV